MEITLEKVPGRAPDKRILVDGAVWGYAQAEHHGMHGTSYDIGQYTDVAGNSWRIITIEEKSNFDRAPRMMAVRVRGKSKSAERHNPDPRSTEQRIIDKARELIEAGHLKSPEAKRAELAAEAEKFRAERAAADAEKKAAFRARAMEAVGGYLGDVDKSEAIDRVVAAMEWAQMQ